MEISPSIPKFILKTYKDNFSEYKDIAHPEIISGLKKVFINTSIYHERNEGNQGNQIVEVKKMPLKITMV